MRARVVLKRSHPELHGLLLPLPLRARQRAQEMEAERRRAGVPGPVPDQCQREERERAGSDEPGRQRRQFLRLPEKDQSPGNRGQRSGQDVVIAVAAGSAVGKDSEGRVEERPGAGRQDQQPEPRLTPGRALDEEREPAQDQEEQPAVARPGDEDVLEVRGIEEELVPETEQLGRMPEMSAERKFQAQSVRRVSIMEAEGGP